MATIQSPPNSVWLNGLQTDSEGYVNFYPLGTNKVDISTITWPEGTKVQSPFVYQDDKLVGFIDTKALEIDNNDTTIDINYTHFEADLDSIMENTLTINAPADATVNVKYGTVDKVLTEKIEKILGKENCKVKFDKNNNKATISLALDTTEEQIAAVETLFRRVLPQNIVTEMYWADGFPMNYTRLEYLESTGTQWMITDFVPNNESGVMARYINNSGNSKHPISTKETVNGTKWGLAVATIRNVSSITSVWGKQVDPSNFQASTAAIIVGKTNYLNSREIRWQNTETNYNLIRVIGRDYVSPLPYTPTVPFHFCKDLWYESNVNFSGKLLEAKFSQGEQDACIFVPALDDTGAPCMYDLMARKPFYNSGTGDFTYPGAEQVVQTTGLDEKFYAQLTPNGIRRLYHVPTGCTMSKDEYAAANGFKELVEPPMPLEGYWVPQWRETETQLICDWIETEPPVEEIETLNNEN